MKTSFGVVAAHRFVFVSFIFFVWSIGKTISFLEQRPHCFVREHDSIIQMMRMQPTATRALDLAQQLIRIPSITPHDNGCQTVVLRHLLEELGFACEILPYHDVTNLWAVRSGKANAACIVKPLVVFAGHTDVVPTGPVEHWTHPPFDGVVQRNILYGRGAVDMKGGIASFISALQDFLSQHVTYDGTIGVLLTSDEEGDAIHGTKMVVEELDRRGITIDMAIIGEPSSTNVTGDVVKVGRRGSLGGNLTIHGIQGHVAYPELSRNPIHESLGALKDLVDMQWDNGTQDFRPTTFQITNINSGTGATNVVPGFKKVVFNFRFSPASTPESIKERVEQVLRKHALVYDLNWEDVTYPYETNRDSPLVQAAVASVRKVSGITARTCTSGGTSDGRFLAAAGAQVVELGLINKMIHKIDEHVAVQDLEVLSKMYENLLQRLLLENHEEVEAAVGDPTMLTVFDNSTATNN